MIFIMHDQDDNTPNSTENTAYDNGNSASQWLAKVNASQAAVPADNHSSSETVQSKAAKQFLAQARETTNQRSAQPPAGHARLIFAMDATASRQPTWDRAMQLQAEMFKATALLGGLNVQLCYFRGYNEFTASPWLQGAEDLEAKMRLVSCLGGYTQIEKVMQHALTHQNRQPVRAVVFVGDAVEEDVDQLCHLASKLGQQALPMYIFQEGNDPFASQAFSQLAQCSKGVHLQLTQGSAQALASLLGAVAAWAAGGAPALNRYVADQQTAGKGSLLLTQLSHTLLEDFDAKT